MQSINKYSTPEEFIVEIPLYENIVFDDDNLDKNYTPEVESPLLKY
ncbi:hypothetical protein [Poseidonibacter sp.]